MKLNKDTETWAPIPEWPGYAASSFGRIRSLDKFVDQRCGPAKHTSKKFYPGKILKLSTDRDGYFRVHLSIQGRRTLALPAHRFIYAAFVGPLIPGMVINHKDFNRQNNTPGNLEQVTVKENDHHSMVAGRKGRLTEEEVREIRSTESYAILRNKYGLDTATLWHIRVGNIYKWVSGPLVPRTSERPKGWRKDQVKRLGIVSRNQWTGPLKKNQSA